MKPLDSDKKVEKAAATPVEAAPVVEEKIDFSNVVIEPLFEDFVDFETFSKSDFRAVKVLECEAVPKSKKLLKFTLDDGTGVNRTILSGIHAFYEPEELVGKTLIAITNLPPRPMMGIDSCGMLLSAINKRGEEEELHLLMVDMVDESRIALRPAVELSYLKKEEQSALLEEISYADATPSLAQAIKMKKFSQEGKLSNDVIESIMSEEKPNLVVDGFEHSRKIKAVKKSLCNQNGITYCEINSKDPFAMAAQIKALFRKNHVYITSENENDIRFCRNLFFSVKRKNARTS